MKREIRTDIIEKMFTVSSSNAFIISSLRLLLPIGKERFKCCIAGVLSLFPTIIMAISYDTIPLFLDSVQTSLEIILALFGIVFTGYALFQALIGKEMLIRMLQSITYKGGKEISKLQESNELFAETMMLQFLCISGSFLLLVVLKCVPEDWCLFGNKSQNDFFAGVGIFIYFYVMFNAVIEIKSFVFNMIELFNFHAGTRVIELLQESEKEN